MDTSRSTRPMIQWDFARGRQRLRCAIAKKRRAFDVAVLPIGSAGTAVSRRFSGVLDALRHHAAIAAGLRADGWKLVGYTE